MRESDGIQLFSQLFEAAKRFSHYDFCSELLSTLEEVDLQRPTSHHWVQYYEGKLGRLTDNAAWEQAHVINQMLYVMPDLEPSLRARVTSDLGRYYYHMSCQYLEAAAALEESLELRRHVDSEVWEAYVLSHLGPAYAAAGFLEKARKAGQRCVSLSRDLGDLYQEGWGRYSLGNSEGHAGNWGEAIPHLERAVELFQSLDAQFELGVVLRRIGRAQLQLGRWDEALANYRANLALMRKYDKPAWALRALVDVCELHLARGDQEALALSATEASAMLERHPNPAQHSRLRGLQAVAALRRGEAVEASRLYADALLDLVQTTGCVDQEVVGRMIGELRRLATGGGAGAGPPGG